MNFHFKDSILSQISLPEIFINRTFGFAYLSLLETSGMITLGILKTESNNYLGNQFPFVITNPPPSLLMEKSDLLFVLKTQ